MSWYRWTFGRFTNLDVNNKIAPDLAETWTISDDAMTYTFNLRKGVKWDDGTPFTSKDVVTTFTWHCTKDVSSNQFAWIKSLAGCQDYYDGKATSIPGITAPDDSTVVFKLGTLSPIFWYSFQFVPIIQDAALAKIKPADFATSDFVLKRPYPGIGPFQFRSFVPDQSVEFVANPNYWGGKPKIDWIIETKIPDLNTMIAAFEKGEIDIFDGPPATEYDRITKMPGAQLIPYLATIGGWWVNYHTDAANKDDPKYVAMRKP